MLACCAGAVADADADAEMLGQARFWPRMLMSAGILFTVGIGRYHGSNSRQTNNRKEALQTVGLGEKTDGM